MNRKAVSGLMLVMILTALTLVFNTRAYNTTETIYIKADGSVLPVDAPINHTGSIYTFYDDVVFEGAGVSPARW